MLRRQSVKSKSQLERRKSTSSVHGVHLEHLDAAAAQRDAQIAACQAYTRALHRAAADMPTFPPTPDPSPRRHQAGGSTPSRDGCDKETLGLQQSVLFIGPCSVRGGPSELGREPTVDAAAPDPSLQPEGHDLTGSDCIGTSGSNLHSAERTQPHTFRHPQGEPPSGPLSSIAAGYIEALAAGEEYYTPEDDIASAPSSYRRLRRSRSLYTSDDYQPRPSHDDSTSLFDGKSSVLHDRRAPQSEPRSSAYTQPMSPLRALRSMNFAGNQNLSSPLSRPSRESARDYSESETPSLPAARPLLTAQSTPQLNSRSATMVYTSRDRRSGLGMPKSLRSGSSSDGSGIPPMVSMMDLDKEDSFKYKAKKASRSLKTRLRSFFSLSRSEEHAPSLPIQHIDSRRAHTSGASSVPPIDGVRSTTELEESIQMVPSGVPTLQVPSGSIHSIRGSFESMRSERERKVSNDGSLTSWTHSGPSTLTSQQQQQWKNEWERQRLSVIKENGAHCPSPSLRRQGLDPLLFQNPDNQRGGQDSRGFVMDSQRIYSALIKRVQAINEKTNQIIEQKQRSANINPAATLNPQNEVEVGGQDTPPNRLAGGDGSANQEPWAEQQRASLLTPRNRNAGYFDQSLVGLRGPARKNEVGHSRFEFESLTNSGHCSPDPLICRPESPTLPADDPYSSSYRKPVASGDASSHLFRTGSPFRQALRKSMEEEQMAMVEDQQDSDSGLQGSECDTEIRTTNLSVHADVVLEREISGDYAESVYSTDEAMTAPVPGRPNVAGLSRDLSEFLDSRDSLYSIGHHTDTSGNSIDWKTWLSANVAKMESPSPPRPEEIESVMPTRRDSHAGGHVREAAQIHEDDDDSDIIVAEPLARQPTLPNLPLATIEPNVVKLSPHQRPDKHSTPPAYNRLSLYENNSPMCTPPIPPRSMLRTESSSSPLKRPMPNKGPSMQGSISSSPGLSAAVQRQFGHVSGSGGRVITYRANEAMEESNDNVYVDINYHQGGSSSPHVGAFL